MLHEQKLQSLHCSDRRVENTKLMWSTVSVSASKTEGLFKYSVSKPPKVLCIVSLLVQFVSTFWKHTVKVNLVLLFVERWSLNCLKKYLFSADIHQICGKKSRLAAVVSRNRFETYVFKLHIYFKQWNAQNAALFGSSSTAADIPRTFANACHHLFSWSVKAQVTFKEKFQGE